MKRIVSTLFTFLLSASLFAQQHLSFLGVPIDGSLTEFVSALEEKGLVAGDYIDTNIATLTTEKNGQPITVLAVATKDLRHTYKVVVMPEPKYGWKNLRNEYLNNKRALVAAYGEPDECYEFFLPPYNTRRMMKRYALKALNEGYAQWVSAFTITGTGDETIGSILLEIRPYAHLARVVTTLEDEANARFAEEE